MYIKLLRLMDKLTYFLTALVVVTKIGVINSSSSVFTKKFIK